MKKFFLIILLAGAGCAAALADSGPDCCMQDGGVCGNRCCNGRPLANSRAPYYPYCGMNDEVIYRRHYYNRNRHWEERDPNPQLWSYLPTAPILLNDRLLRAYAVVVDGRAMAPVRGVFENMGAKVDYDPETRRVSIRVQTRTVSISADEYTAFVYDHNEKKSTAYLEVPMDTPPIVIEGHMFIPLRFISEQFDATVHWTDNPPSVHISAREYPWYIQDRHVWHY